MCYFPNTLCTFLPFHLPYNILEYFIHFFLISFMRASPLHYVFLLLDNFSLVFFLSFSIKACLSVIIGRKHSNVIVSATLCNSHWYNIHHAEDKTAPLVEHQMMMKLTFREANDLPKATTKWGWHSSKRRGSHENGVGNSVRYAASVVSVSYCIRDGWQIHFSSYY